MVTQQNNNKSRTLTAPSASVGGDTTFSVRGLLFMQQSKFLPLKKEPKYYAHVSGYIFFCRDGKDIIIPPVRLTKRRVVVFFRAKQYDLIDLLIETFGIDYRATDKIDYSITREGYIPVNSIKVSAVIDRCVGIDDKLKKKIAYFNCDTKAFSANQRGVGIISPLEVYQVLERMEYKCFYCWKGITSKKWHLDHFIPISKGGNNASKNLVVSCPSCNLMKGDMLYSEFVKRCQTISDIHKHYN